ncbi:hypothetical protein KQI68_06980 [Peptoniphilus sp. MSJ-1]|uniref:Penicillin-binding protein-related factor A, recombinase n=1 Tax=Peptoniphilus ovalis TaxID=2841503 RepID=A0ABS6FHY3_9FIRM|nr:hypothetical protein [Peptoniphilus ovalis]MBU5669581.1 hypothetical protein [Peptoniphilus ovalis]
MAKKNEGKKFEEDFRNSIPEDVFCYRIKDSSNFYQATKNMCDFILFKSPYLILLELKSTKANQISMDEKIVKEHQIQELYQAKHLSENIVAGFLLNYRGRELKTKTVLPETYFIPIENMKKVYETQKSLHKEQAKAIGIEIPFTKKITRFTYDFPIDLISKEC